MCAKYFKKKLILKNLHKYIIYFTSFKTWQFILFFGNK